MINLLSPIGWVGGKGIIAPRIVKMLPIHNYYLEPFCGAANVLFCKPKVKVEIINDIDTDITNFFLTLQDKILYQQLLDQLVHTPFARYIFNIHKNKHGALSFFIKQNMSFGGKVQTWGYSYKAVSQNMPSNIAKYLGCIYKIPLAHQRLQGVEIHNCNWYDICKEHNNSNFVWYLDPPYVPSTRMCNFYQYEMSEEQHYELIDFIVDCKAKVCLSGYDNPIYDTLLNFNWKKRTWDVACHIVGKTRDTQILGKQSTYIHNQRRKECIWYNF